MIVDTALDDIGTFARAGLLLVVGAALWGLNRIVEGPHEDIEAEGLAG